MTDPLPITPFTRPVQGQITLPGSKSITNRALILAALAEDSTMLENTLFSRDTEIMVAALQQMGFAIEVFPAEKRIKVEGKGGVIPRKKADLHIGNAGTAARFLAAFCASSNLGTYSMDGDPQMRFRPMKGLLDGLRNMGTQIQANNDCFPLTIKSKGLAGGEITIDASASSQFLSALLMVAPRARKNVILKLNADTVSKPFVNMTLSMMNQFGQPLFGQISPNVYQIEVGRPYHAPMANVFTIEGDATAASYFLTLPSIVGGEVLIPGLRFSGLQGDVDFVKVLNLTGSSVEATPRGMLAQVADPARSRRGITYNFADISDTFLTLAAVAPLYEGQTRITGISHTRKQETDRVKAMASELRRLGVQVQEEEDSLTIEGNPQALRPGTVVRTYQDHRIAMSFAILGSYDLLNNGLPWLKIKDPACCAKTFPDFFTVLEELRQNSHS